MTIDLATDGWLSGLGLATDGYYADDGLGTGIAVAPIVSNITPARGVTAGGAGAFSASYTDASSTPIEFDITNIASGAGITIAVKFSDRDETYVALDHDGVWQWPFDVDSSIGPLDSEPVHVVLLPRDGWPPASVAVRVAAVMPALEAP